MEAKLRTTPSRTHQEMVDSGVEAAVTRLMRNGLTRMEALVKVSGALSGAVSILANVGIGDMARLRAQMMTASAKLAAEQDAVVDQLDAQVGGESRG